MLECKTREVHLQRLQLIFYLNPSFGSQQIYVRAEPLVALIPILHSHAVFTWKREKFYTNLQMMIMNKMNRS